MNNRFLRITILVLQTFCFAVGIGIAIYGIVVSQEAKATSIYVTSVIRLISLLLVTLAYYKNNVSVNNPGNLFTILFLFFATVVELQVFSYFSKLTGWSILPARVSVRLAMFSTFMMYLSLLGFALFNQNNEHGASSRFMLFGLVCMLAISQTIPATQDVFGIWNMTTPLLMITVLASLAAIAHFILIASDPQKSWILRQLATVLMIAGSYLIAVPAAFIYITIGTAMFTVGAIILTIMTLRNSVFL